MRIGRSGSKRLSLLALVVALASGDAFAAKLCSDSPQSSALLRATSRLGGEQEPPDGEVWVSDRVEATPEEVWGVLTDYDAWAEIFPDMTPAQIEKRGAARYAVRTSSGGLGYTVEFTQVHTLRPEEGRIAMELDRSRPSSIEDVTGDWRLLSTPDGSATIVQLRLRMVSGLPIPGFMERRAVEESMERSVDAVVAEVDRRCGRVHVASAEAP